MEFTSGVKNEVVSEETSQILEIILVNPTSNVWKTQKNKKCHLHIPKSVTLSDTTTRATMIW